MTTTSPTPEDHRELVMLRSWWATNVARFPVFALNRMMEAVKQARPLEARTWRERAAEWRAIATFVREVTSHRMMHDAERARLLRELREAKRKHDAWTRSQEEVTRGQ
ncbi:MAG: hypothetical protein JST00_31680 [Deltaproteobacteria bacterium]|nr:hypothetical protein [Deltaproteobacteria bacterium]